MDKIYVVTAVDCGDSCDGRAHVLAAFRNVDDAKAYVRNDMEDRADQLAGCNITMDFDEKSITNHDEDDVRLWNIEDVEIQ